MLEAGASCIRIYDHKFAIVDYIELKGDSDNSFISDFSIDKVDHVFACIFEGGAKFCNIKIMGNIKCLNDCDSKKLKNYHKVEFLQLHQYWAFLSKLGEIRLSTAHYKSRTIIEYTVHIVIKQH